MKSNSRQASQPTLAGRRRLLLALATAPLIVPLSASAQSGSVLSRPIPSSGQALPVIGLGSWITFNVGNDRVARDNCAEVMRNFFAAGGRVVDSSPMYGSSQEVIGYGLGKLNNAGQAAPVFAADKVWISSGARGPGQIETSRQNWNVPRFDLLQVHNLLAWQEHLPTLLAMKAAGQLRYVGITTSEGRRHREFEQIMASQPIDFVQVTYNVLDREVEAAHFSARTRAPDRSHRQPAVSPRRADSFGRAPSPSRMGGRDRLRKLGADPVEVHDLASGGYLRDPGHLKRRARAREHGRRGWTLAR